MAFKDVIKFENSFISQGGISPTVGTLNGTYEAGKIGQGYRSFRTGGELSYTPSDFGIDLNSNRWGFITWAKPNKTSLDTVAERHDLMNIGTYYNVGETDIYAGFHTSTLGQRNFNCGSVYENQVGKSGLNSVNFDDWTVQNWFLYGIWCDGTDFGRMIWDPVEGLRAYSRSISWDSNTYPFEDKLIVSGYDWDFDGWGGSVDELRIYDGPFTQKEFTDLAKGKEIHYKFNTYEQTVENEFLDNWTALVTDSAQLASYGGPGTLQVGAVDPFGSTDSSVYRKSGNRLRFGELDGTDVGTLYSGETYTFSIYLRHVYDEENVSSADFDICDQADLRSYSGTLGSNMSYVWKRFWVTAKHDTTSTYHFIDVGQAGTAVFEWCCPQIEQRVKYPNNELSYYLNTNLNVSPYTTGITGVVNDDSGNGNDVTLTYENSPYWVGDASDGRKCYLFPGLSRKKIVTPIDTSARTDNVTFSCWAFQLDVSTQYGASGSIYLQYIMSQGRDTGSRGISLYTNTGQIYSSYSGPGGTVGLGSGGFLTGGWRHLAVTYDISVGGKLYVDGLLKDSDIAVGPLDYAQASDSFAVGKMSYSNTSTINYFPFNGYIDDARVYSTTLDASAIIEVMQQRGSIDKEGNFYTGDIQETGHVPLIIDYTEWTVGSGGTTNFVQNGGTAENERILATDPWGNDDAIVWECRPDASPSAAGGWNTSQFDIDNTKMYRYSHWVQRNAVIGTTHGASYLGLNGYGSTDGVYERDSGSNNTNPYFMSSYTIPSPGQWELFVGHVWPAGSSTGSNHPESGRYTVEDGLFSTTGFNRDYVWRSETTTANQRSYLYYSDIDVSMRQQFLYPRVDVIDGTEPSIEDLLGGFDAVYSDYIKSKGGTSYINLDVGFSETKVGHLSEISISEDLLLWYPLQGTYTPAGKAYEMVKGLDGTFTGDPSITSRGYDFVDGVEFVDSYDLSDSNLFNSNSITAISFSAWVNRTSSINDYNMFMGQQLPYFSHRSYGAYLFSARISGTQRAVYSDSSTANVDGVWRHIVGTYDGEDMVIYVDAVLDGSANWPGVLQVNAAEVFGIGGGRMSSPWYPFNGKISDVRVYSKVLAAAEIEVLYKTTDPESTNTAKLTKDTIYLKGELKES